MKNIVAFVKGAWAIAVGLVTVGKHAFRPNITLRYPEQKARDLPRAKGRLALLRNSEGKELCTGCKICSRVCPCGDLIQIETGKNTDNKPVATRYTIDIGRCIFCGNCVEACAFAALEMTGDFELADLTREGLVLDKERLTLSATDSDRLRKRQARDPY